MVTIGRIRIEGYDEAALRNASTTAGYPAKAEAMDMNRPLVVAIIVALMLIATATYGPLALVVAELFPPVSAIPPCPCLTILATAGLAAFYLPSRLRWWFTPGYPLRALVPDCSNSHKPGAHQP